MQQSNKSEAIMDTRRISVESSEGREARLALLQCKDKVSARLYIEHGDSYLNLSAFDDVLRATTRRNQVTPQLLLGCKPATITYRDSIIVSVEMD